MLPGMGFLDSLKKAIQGPPRVQGMGSDEPGEVAAALHEEYAAPDPGPSESKQIEELNDGPGATAAAPFAGAGQIRAAEVEAEIVRPEDVRPDEMEIASEEEGPIDPDT
jgi:hypothetical protein